MSTEASILHADVDAFFASVEQRDEPRLRGKPVIVGGGVVLAASYEARAYGIHSAMGGARARRLCPHALVVQPRFSAYVEASRAVFEIFKRTSPVVEGLGLEEAFLDVRGMEHFMGTAREIAQRLRAEIREEVGLAATVGVATTKFLAKVASGVAKPDGLLVVAAGGELEFLHPLPVERLWGVGPKTAARLHAVGLTTVASVAALREGELVELLGKASGRHLHALAHNRDPRRVRGGRRRRSVGAQRALGRRRRPWSELETSLVALVDKVCRRMRSGRRVCRTVVLRMRFGDYTRATRSRTMAEATGATQPILAALRALLDEARRTIERRGLTLIGVSLTNLCDDDAVQLALPFERDVGAVVDTAVDHVRERFGTTAITRAVLLGRDASFSAALMPDEEPGAPRRDQGP